MGKAKVLIITNIHAVLEEALLAQGYELLKDLGMDADRLGPLVDQFEGIVTSTKIKFDQSLLCKATKLKWIARMGSGMEHIDLLAAKTRNITCISSPEGNANSVAEQALGMFLALEHNVFKSDRELQSEIWLRDENRGREVEGSTAGIIGMGHNGGLFAKKLNCLGVNVLGYDPYRNDFERESIKKVDDLQEIYESCTVLSFHVPYTQETHHYFNADFCASMKNSFTLLNLSRGEVVDQHAVLTGLQSGKIRAAGLDVWEEEPLFSSKNNDLTKKLLAHPNFIGTAHIGGYSHQAIYKMSLALKNKLQHLVWNPA